MHDCRSAVHELATASSRFLNSGGQRRAETVDPIEEFLDLALGRLVREGQSRRHQWCSDTTLSTMIRESDRSVRTYPSMPRPRFAT